MPGWQIISAGGYLRYLGEIDRYAARWGSGGPDPGPKSGGHRSGGGVGESGCQDFDPVPVPRPALGCVQGFSGA